MQLKYMTSHDIPFLAKGGGHGVSLSLATVQEAVMINMETFNRVASYDAGREGSKYKSIGQLVAGHARAN